MEESTGTSSTWIDRHTTESMEQARWTLDNADSPVICLRGLAMVRPELDRLELEAVRDCRRHGYSWEKIAEALLRQKQAVWKQYAPLLNESSATEMKPPELA